MVFLPINNLLLALASPLANQGIASNHFNVGARAMAPLGGGVPLRIMPLGASITYGQGSSDGNGYRGPLRAQLTGDFGNAVNMVGSRQSGSMRDNDVEGWPGFRIDEVHEKAAAPESVPRWRPNVVLVNAGTNDAAQDWNVTTAGRRMEAMLADVWRMSPRAVVVLSTLLLNKNGDTERRVLNINGQFRQLVARLRDRERRRIILAEMHGDDGPGSADFVDDTHPNDVGYKKMANVWLKGLVAASDAGMLQAPERVPGVPDDGAA
ncbi:SGNH hydrolase-type esterase domain-containing protein [Madurella fahalii]|uniref:SGNH hydrolase-type esterase domain-containing protein n=1 Tax=Madurella fahalii TaxID=1157608 RepID=A0ABQ0GNP8_9PEZI